MLCMLVSIVMDVTVEDEGLIDKSTLKIHRPASSLQFRRHAANLSHSATVATLGAHAEK
jgi:hypothetical protein